MINGFYNQAVSDCQDLNHMCAQFDAQNFSQDNFENPCVDDTGKQVVQAEMFLRIDTYRWQQEESQATKITRIECSEDWRWHLRLQHATQGDRARLHWRAVGWAASSRPLGPDSAPGYLHDHENFVSTVLLFRLNKTVS